VRLLQPSIRESLRPFSNLDNFLNNVNPVWPTAFVIKKSDAFMAGQFKDLSSTSIESRQNLEISRSRWQRSRLQYDYGEETKKREEAVKACA